MTKRERNTLSFVAGHTLYPSTMKAAGRAALLRRWIFWGLVASCALCVMLNALIGGFPWCLYVLLSSYVFYGVFVSRSLVDASVIGKLLTSVVSASALLLLVQFLGGGQWATQIAVPMVLLGGVIVGMLLYMPKRPLQRPYIAPLFLLILVGIAFPVAAMVVTGRLHWAHISLLATSLAACVVSGVWLRTPIWQELKKKASTA